MATDTHPDSKPSPDEQAHNGGFVVKFPMADGREPPLGYGLVTSGPASRGQDDTRWTCDDVLKVWSPFTRGTRLPLVAGQEWFIIDTVLSDRPKSAAIEGGSANLACFLHLVWKLAPATWERSPLGSARVRGIWASGKLVSSGLQQVDRLDQKLVVVAGEAHRQRGEHWFFTPVQQFRVSLAQEAHPEVDLEVLEWTREDGPIRTPNNSGAPPDGSDRARVVIVQVPSDGLTRLLDWIRSFQETSAPRPSRDKPDGVAREATAEIAAAKGGGWRWRLWHTIALITSMLVLAFVLWAWLPCPSAVSVTKQIDGYADLLGEKHEYAEAREVLVAGQERALEAFECCEDDSPDRPLVAEQALRALYLRAFVDFTELLDCAGLYRRTQGARECTPTEQRKLLESANTLLGRDRAESFTMVQRSLAPYVQADCTTCQRRVSLAANLELRFDPKPLIPATMMRKFESALEVHRCSDYTQGWNLWVALLSVRGKYDSKSDRDARTLDHLGRILAPATKHPSQDRAACPTLTDDKRSDRLASLETIGLSEALLFSPADKPVWQLEAKGLACAAYEVVATDHGVARTPELDRACSAPPRDSDLALIRLLLHNLERRERGEPWRIDERWASPPTRSGP